MSNEIYEGEKTDLDIRQGSTYRHSFYFVKSSNTPVNIEHYIARMQFRRSVYSEEVLFEANTENEKLTIAGSSGRVLLEIPALETQSFEFRRAVFDLELITPSDRVMMLCYGKINITKEITR